MFSRIKIYLIWCRRGDSNPHELPHTPLKRARLPVPPLRHEVSLEGGYYSRTISKNCTYWLAAGEAAGAAGEGCCTGDGVGVATGAISDCNTDREPESIGKPSV